MDLEDRDLSPDERSLAMQLSALTTDPTAERRQKIMSTVRAAQPARRPSGLSWRVAVAGTAAAAILVFSAAGAVAASGDALPRSPNYPLRVAGEQFRLVLADTGGREHLRISFAQTRIGQARTALARGDRADAQDLLRDSRGYLDQARQDVSGLSAGEQGQVENQLNQAEADQQQAESQADQQGQQGQ